MAWTHSVLKPAVAGANSLLRVSHVRCCVLPKISIVLIIGQMLFCYPSIPPSFTSHSLFFLCLTRFNRLVILIAKS